MDVIVNLSNIIQTFHNNFKLTFWYWNGELEILFLFSTSKLYENRIPSKMELTVLKQIRGNNAIIIQNIWGISGSILF